MAGPCRRVLAVLATTLLLNLVLVDALAAQPTLGQPAEPMLEARGQTMGTVYLVKVFAPPSDFPSDWKERIDRELRLVNDQMSTYLESSEISRFNRSDIVEWFEVSPETALVVAKSLAVYRDSEGAFDVTVAPLVNAWSFGPGKRSNKPPTSDQVDELRERIGSQYLDVRLEPPAIRKSRPDLSVDLSAIAKGHGVDRIVDLLDSLGAANVFVEIGGDLRVRGDKAGRPWMVGIQEPDVTGDVVARAIPLRDRAIATSGDYRNYFEHEGRRYSHTIDPRSGEPIRHATASVSVIAEDCMTADAWATAINVLGPETGPRVAERAGLEALMLVRDGEDQFVALSHGAAFATNDGAVPNSSASNDFSADVEARGGWLPIVVLTALAFAVALAAMAIGVMFGRRSISGSCGGLANQSDGEGGSRCALCSQPDEACSRLRAAAQAKGEVDSVSK